MASHLRALAPLVVMGGVLVLGSAACSGGDAADGSDPGGTFGGGQTDVGCGGTGAPKCAEGKKCRVGSDCASGVCRSDTCAAPSPSDGVRNGDETDVDCGGTKAPRCAVGKSCTGHGDCASDACAYDQKCVEHKGCTGHFGGDTCGDGETGDTNAKHESCCTTIAVTDRPAGSFVVDKYHVTAGRMRAFVERYGGDLQSWAATNPKNWNQAWNDKLPASLSDAHYLLGPGSMRGCSVANQGGRTYWQPPVDGDTAEQSDFSQDVLDEKALNCVTWYMAAAVCAFDGGRLPSNAEVKWLFENGGKSQYPWQVHDPGSYDPNVADEHLVHRYSYQTPNPPDTMRIVGTGPDAYPLDHAFWVAPPGRRPKGANTYGVQDMAGNLAIWVNDQEKYFTGTMSWEKHAKNLTAGRYGDQDNSDGYYALGVRCVRDL